MATNVLFQNGFYQTKVESFDPQRLINALQSFVLQDTAYTHQFLQKNYSHGLDGYSFLGQKDSANQYHFDLLHSFVISEFHTPDQFPKEFLEFFEIDWHRLKAKIVEVELGIIAQLEIPGLKEMYQEVMGHMISCNYYPRLQPHQLTQPERLSAHKDVSLFTVFPFGFDSDFSFEWKGEWHTITATEDMVVFPGYLLEVISNGAIPALNHKVNQPQNPLQERFSFAYFSIPFPIKTIRVGNVHLTAEAYFEQYLQLFD